MDKRYDPNVERRELTKLKAEHKREKKGAVREIRKDSRFISRVKLAEDKETSKAYHAKMARLTAMIQSEEGAAANEYKRQKASRR
jgi:nucleolar protein 14